MFLNNILNVHIGSVCILLMLTRFIAAKFFSQLNHISLQIKPAFGGHGLKDHQKCASIWSALQNNWAAEAPLKMNRQSSILRNMYLTALQKLCTSGFHPRNSNHSLQVQYKVTLVTEACVVVSFFEIKLLS